MRRVRRKVDGPEIQGQGWLLSGHVRHSILNLNLAFPVVMKVYVSWQQDKPYFNERFVSL